MAMKYPAECVTPGLKLEFLYEALGAAMSRHNAESVKFKGKQITRTEWEAFHDDHRQNLELAITTEIGVQRAAAMGQVKYAPDLSRLFDGS